jgi:hypothetical protein
MFFKDRKSDLYVICFILEIQNQMKCFQLTRKSTEIVEQKFCVRTFTCCIKLVSYLSILPKVFTSFMQQVKVRTQSKICKLHVYVVIFCNFLLVSYLSILPQVFTRRKLQKLTT